jgi:hypothetical protein
MLLFHSPAVCDTVPLDDMNLWIPQCASHHGNRRVRSFDGNPEGPWRVLFHPKSTRDCIKINNTNAASFLPAIAAFVLKAALNLWALTLTYGY